MKHLKKKWAVVLVGLFSIFLFMFISINFVESKPVKSIKTMGPAVPYTIRIPKMNVNTVVESVGLTTDGSMDAPVGPNETGWYNGGVEPGVVGSAVIDGHSGWNGGIPAVFDNFSKLKKGDNIYITNQMGVVTTFIVRKTKTYKPNSVVPDIFNSTDGIAHLNLIACSGTWNTKTKTHSSRLVVFTDKVLSTQ